MKRKLCLLALVGAVLLSAAPVLADEGFYVIGGGGGVGTKITSLPYEIKNAGFYYLTGNLACASGNGITVSSDDVTIDLMGFCLSGNPSGHGIYMDSKKNVEIRNGTLRGWGSDVIREASITGANHRIINIRSETNTYPISLAGYGHVIKGCAISDSSYDGISLNGSGTISGNVINNCGQNGITCFKSGNIIGNTVTCNSGQTGIWLNGSASDNVLLDQNTVSGAGTHFSPALTPYVKGTNAGF